MTTKTKPHHGGPRKGAGRKPLHGKNMIQRHVLVTEQQIIKALKIGQGEFSRGVRKAIDDAKQ